MCEPYAKICFDYREVKQRLNCASSVKSVHERYERLGGVTVNYDLRDRKIVLSGSCLLLLLLLLLLHVIVVVHVFLSLLHFFLSKSGGGDGLENGTRYTFSRRRFSPQLQLYSVTCAWVGRWGGGGGGGGGGGQKLLVLVLR